VKEAFICISVFSPIVAIVIGWKKRSLLWCYACIGFLVDFISFASNRTGILPHHKWLYNAFILTEFFIFFSIYGQLLQNKRKRILFTLYALSFFFYYLFSLALQARSLFFILDPINQSNIAVLFVFYISLGIMGLYKLLTLDGIIYLEKEWLFWVSTALLLYGSGDIFLFLFGDHFTSKSDSKYISLWYFVHPTMNTIKNLLIALAIFYYKPKHSERLT
jgi:hypothetical protein